jgi:hypothetical protein
MEISNSQLVLIFPIYTHSRETGTPAADSPLTLVCGVPFSLKFSAVTEIRIFKGTVARLHLHAKYTNVQVYQRHRLAFRVFEGVIVKLAENVHDTIRLMGSGYFQNTELLLCWVALF